MKKLLLVALIGATGFLVWGAGTSASSHYESYQKTKTPARPMISLSAAEQRIEAAKSAVQSALSARYNAAVAECQKGKVAYDKLPTYIKDKTPAPVCPAPSAQ